ncbi:hypothetical protein EG68_00873 [Paragonimus skrjabini miyazakii]|uniref:Uncharacterized protein n=1 Tax=Paragonimus skrjabini miyazakii TaxID=59628 RepID=A0A8S9Z951_9TREM|nr:hypothetical protein EG68_00873 [Paragonimus skrjabini miyazakii]
MMKFIQYENWGWPCEHLIEQNGRQLTVELHPLESWPFPTTRTHWRIKFCKLTFRWCQVVQLTAGRLRRCMTFAKVKFISSTSAMIVSGKFKDDFAGRRDRAHFCLYLTTRVDDTEFRDGVELTGSLERGNRKKACWETTHYVCIKHK